MSNLLSSAFSILLFAATAATAAGVTGIWAGQMPSRRAGELEDVAFKLQQNGATFTGTMFGDEFDLPVEEASFKDGEIRFAVTTTNYYNGNKTKIVFSGKITGSEMELTRERSPAPAQANPDTASAKQTFKLKKLT